MPDISVAKASAPYVADHFVQLNRASALRLLHQLLALEGVTTRHLVEQLKIGMWKWTEAEGVGPLPKFNTRYFSAGVMAQQGPVKINHEHVWTMKNHVKALRARTWTLDELERYLTTYGTACIVTVPEHAQLSGSKLDGWARYQEANIAVYDRSVQKWLDLERPCGETAIDQTQPVNAPVPMTQIDIHATIADRAQPQVATLLTRLLRMARFAYAAPASSMTKIGEISDYFRIHDTLIEEPTAAVAFAHWTGKVDFALTFADLPKFIACDSRVRLLKQSKYAVTTRLADDQSLALAEELLSLSLDKLRSRAASE